MARQAAPRPWYFKTGAPINAEQIRKIVDGAQRYLRPSNEAVNGNGHDAHSYRMSADNPQAPDLRRYVRAMARYLAKRIEQHLVSLLLSELESLRKWRPIRPSGDSRLDAQRTWRRLYQRRYRIGRRAEMETSAHEAE